MLWLLQCFFKRVSILLDFQVDIILFLYFFVLTDLVYFLTNLVVSDHNKTEPSLTCLLPRQGSSSMNVMLHLVTMTALIILNTSIFREVRARTRRLESSTSNPG